MGVPSLASLAQRTCIRNIASLKDVGDIPYELLQPILKKIDNVQQLKEIEDNSPHIADHDSELWKAFIKRDIPDWQEKMIYPKNPRSWWKVYRKLMRDENKAKEAQEEQLRAAQEIIQRASEQRMTTVSEKLLSEPNKDYFMDGILNPRKVRTGNWGTGSRSPATKGGQAIQAIKKQSVRESQLKRLGLVHSKTGKQATSGPSAVMRSFGAQPKMTSLSAEELARRKAVKASIETPANIPGAVNAPYTGFEEATEEPKPQQSNGNKALAHAPSSASSPPLRSPPKYSAPLPRKVVRQPAKAPASPASKASSSPEPVSGQKRKLEGSPFPVAKVAPRPSTSIFMPNKKRRMA